MTGDIQLPDMIDPDAPHMEFRVHQCAECGEAGPPALTNNPIWWEWGNKHTDETGHRKFAQWTLTRSIGRMETIPVRKRRSLGTREA